MKKISLLLFSAGLSMPCLAQVPASHTIGLEKAYYRQSPSPLAHQIGTWNYGEQVNELSRKGSWVEVQKDSQKGWLHQSAFSDKKNILEEIGRGDQVSKDSYRDEVVTAGKGFNPEFEKMYKEKNKNLRYDLVDQMEKQKPSIKQIRQFTKSGKLTSHVMGDL